MAQKLTQLDITLFDAPVSGVMASAYAGTISIIASGSPAAYKKVLPVLQAISPNVFYCGDRVGNGQTMKSVNNMMNASCRLAMLELVALGRKMGLPLEELTATINASDARNFPSQTMLPALIEGRKATRFGLPLMLKDVNQAISLGMEVGAPMPIASSVQSLLQVGVNTMGDESQLEDVVRLLESMAGTRIVGGFTAVPAREGVSHLISSALAACNELITCECAAAGFKQVASADFLRNPADPRDVSVNRSGIRNDEFVLKFQKP
jgi:3-hydroxyisobutyrate dehydrogenase